MTAPFYFHDDGFKPVTCGNIGFRGYLFDASDNFAAGKSATESFEHVKTAEELREVITRLDGAFTVTINTDDGLLIGTDTMGLFAMYYAWDGNNWFISDSAHEVKTRTGISKVNKSAIAEFLSAGFVMGKDTLVKGINRTRPAEVLFLKNDGSCQAMIYERFLPDYFSSKSRHDLDQQLGRVLLKTSRRLVDSLQGKTAVIPLSGGYDSRLIACMLKKAGYTNVVCITYGRPNKESEISQKVAQKLGFRWLFIDYREINAAAAINDPLFLDYVKYAGNLSSMPFLQEYFAVDALTKSGAITEDAIFLPGHTGDFLAGSYVEKTAVCNTMKYDRPTWLLKQYFSFIQPGKAMGETIRGRIAAWFDSQEFPAIINCQGYDPLVEEWDLKEKISKFIFNSSRVFPFFGYQFRFPLWDRQLRLFFRRLPYPLRSFKSLYDYHLEEQYFKPLGVYFNRDEIREQKTQLQIQFVKSKLKPFVPEFIKKSRISKRDYLCYKHFTRVMAAELTKEGTRPVKKFNSYNALICQWYVEKFTDNP